MLGLRVALTLKHDGCGDLITNVVCILSINYSGNSLARHPTHSTKKSLRHCWPHHRGDFNGALDRILDMGGSALIPRCLIAHHAVYFRSGATKATTSKRGPRKPFTPTQLFVGPRSIPRVNVQVGRIPIDRTGHFLRSTAVILASIPCGAASGYPGSYSGILFQQG